MSCFLADCSFTFSDSSGEIKAFSIDLENKGHSSCCYHIQAPKQYNIQLNFTQLFGFILPSNNHTTTYNSCLPEIIIKDMMNGEEVRTETVCWQKNNSQAPQVFLSHSNSLKLIFTWRIGHRSGFHIFYHTFHKKDCESGSKINCPLPASSSPTASLDSVKIIVVIVVCAAIFITLGVTICLVMRTQCQLVSRAWHRHSSREAQLRPQSQSSEVFVSTPSSREQMEQQEALLRDRLIQTLSTNRDGRIGCPPQIPISRDGEEGYAESQKQLANQRNLDNTDSQQYFRPPPNRTIYDRKQSPPPYPYTSASSLDTSCGKPSNGYSSVIRCHSVSLNSAKSDSLHQSSSHSRTSSISTTMSSPARYSQLHSNSSLRNYTGTGASSSPPDVVASHESVYNNNNKQFNV
ncbi:hypothetical protein LOTGIDRAFT_155674 [Lottia gigantea]|uniref:CUB domain-containing protein n=1 Tax=Lottia gigantea TaxID=225164 RepID=V3ZP94_LOTGI|nr:hypothetical protein LOTGIDRAFT_155674 [Lottia gigantea]ESO82661.1 hypothetical protein LOTGIDRAFT_155674 [Lottia gigantea]